MDTETTGEVLKLCPQGKLGTQKAARLLASLQQAQAGFELDLSEVESLDICALQVILSAAATMRRLERTSIVKDSETGVLRSALALAGINPEQAGLSARFIL